MARGNQKERAREKTLKAAGNVVSFSQQWSTIFEGWPLCWLFALSRKTRTTYDYAAQLI